MDTLNKSEQLKAMILNKKPDIKKSKPGCTDHFEYLEHLIAFLVHHLGFRTKKIDITGIKFPVILKGYEHLNRLI